ncbi:armadillo repeat-containing protein 4-like [Actinia tenebrosa]|uniref:Armadillo repeat-containing protein 4-like n=1 Tax=Actinia tenebrosa TaxID=6105 RepID=A0A6P8HBW7_ACTTE|nr:armadillo repeat-containing protein 4-like [Actinia tenebrosa]
MATGTYIMEQPEQELEAARTDEKIDYQSVNPTDPQNSSQDISSSDPPISPQPEQRKNSFLDKYLSESSEDEEADEESEAEEKRKNEPRKSNKTKKNEARKSNTKQEEKNNQRNKRVKIKKKGDSSEKKIEKEKDIGTEIRRYTTGRQPSTKWQNLRLFEDDNVESDEETKNKQTPTKARSVRTESRRYTVMSERKSVIGRADTENSESSTESQEEDDRVLDGKINAADLPSEFWQIQRMVKFLKIGNPTATVLCLCALKDFNLSLEMSQMAIREVNGLRVLINILRTENQRCKIGSLNILLPLTTNSKYNINIIIKLGGVPIMVDLVANGGKEVQGLAAATLANLAMSSRARNILRRCGGIQKMVKLLRLQNEQAKNNPSKSQEQKKMDLEVYRCAALALWSCSKSRCSRTTIYKTGSVPLLAKLIQIDREEILIPVIGLVQECAIEARFRHAFLQENMIETIVQHLQTENEELQTYCANAIFKCAEDEETRKIVNRFGGLKPLVALLSQSGNKKLLAAVTGAVWKCSISTDNAQRFLEMNIVEILLKYLQDPEQQQPEDVEIHIVGALAELSKIDLGCRELLACKGCKTLVKLSTTPNEKLVEQVSRAIAASSKYRECRDLINHLDGLRLLWSLLKSNNPKVVSSAAWGIYGLTEDTPDAWENARSFVGGLELIVNLLKSDDIEVLTSICAAISNIANDYENIGVLQDYGVVPLLAKMTSINDMELRQHLAEAIARCSKWENNAQEFSKEGAVEAMVEYLSTDDMNVKRSAVRALHQLAKNADSCIKMHDKGVVKPLVQMVGSDDEALQEAAASPTLENLLWPMKKQGQIIKRGHQQVLKEGIKVHQQKVSSMAVRRKRKLVII